MWVKQCHTPPMTGNGLYRIPTIYGDLGDGLLLFYPHYTITINKNQSLV